MTFGRALHFHIGLSADEKIFAVHNLILASHSNLLQMKLDGFLDLEFMTLQRKMVCSRQIAVLLVQFLV